jgi:hypothetical protein
MNRSTDKTASAPPANGTAGAPSQPNGTGPGHPPAALAPLPLLLTLDQASAFTGFSTRTLKRMASEPGALPDGAVLRPYGRVRRFSRVVLERWIGEGCPRPGRGRR